MVIYELEAETRIKAELNTSAAGRFLPREEAANGVVAFSS